MKFPSCWFPIALAAALISALPLRAIQPPAHEPLPNFDKREAAATAEQPPPPPGTDAAREAAEKLLRSRVPGVAIQRAPGRKTPKTIGSTRGFLTGPEGEGGAVPPATTRGLAADDAQRGVKAFLEEHRALFGHGAEALAAARTTREETHGNLRTSVWQQELDGIEVFEAVLKAHSTVRGELVNLASAFVPNLAVAVAKGAPNRAARLATPAVTAPQAVALAAQNLGDAVQAANVVVTELEDGPERKQRLRAPLVLDVSAQFTWLPLDEETLRLCWQVVLVRKASGEMFKLLVDAETGEVLLRHGLTNYATDASYRVYPSDSPSPFSPGHPTPSSVQPPVVARTLVTTPGFNLTASPNGWIDDGVNETRGNNADAHTDTDANNSPDLPRPQGSPNRVFDFPLNLTQAPNTYREAAVTNLFYWCNVIHDRFYELGFTEAAGNFQNTNFGRGGLGNDAVQADAQDGSGTNNANFSTPPDGTPGRMQMFVFTGPTPDIDGDFDHEIVIHEYAHGLSNRLVGGGVGISALQPRGMGEGWGDFYGLCLLSEPTDDPNAVYASGGYATFQLGALTENYYYGIRRYPYSTDLAKNPLTFKDIDPTQASPHTGIPRSPIIGNTASEVHNMGEVWCVTLWDARANLIAKHGATTGNQLILQLVTDGMKLAPVNPNFLEARDAVLQAELVLTGGANRNELWTAFAKRGMGAGATSPASSTSTGVFENYDLPDDLAIAPSGIVAFTGTIGGPFTPAAATWTLVNTGSAPLNWTAVKTQPWLTVAPASGTLAVGASAPVTVSVNAAGATLNTGAFADTVTFTNLTSGLAQTRVVQLTVEPVTIPIFLEPWETGTIRSAWSITGTGTPRTEVTTANGPHGGLYHLTMDSTTEVSNARNEATLTVDLAGRQNVRLRFWLKMFGDEANGPPTSPFIGGADFDGIAVSEDGTTWYEVLGLRTLNGAWVQHTVDLDAAVAALGLSYNAAFKIRFNHFDNYPIATDGFAFDDIEVAEISANRLQLIVPAGVSEAAGSAPATLRVLPVPTVPVTVTLSSSDPTEAGLPATVVVAAGQANVPLPLAIFDDPLLDGTQTVVLTATAAGYPNGVALLPVHDNETATLTLQIPRAAREQDGVVSGTVTLSRLADGPIEVTLLSSDPSEVTVPPSVTVPVGQLSTAFPITIVNDERLDPKVATTISASIVNWTGDTKSISIYDDESTAVVVSLPALREGDGVRTGTVQIGGTLTDVLTVYLVSGDLTELTVPATMTIAAGQTSGTFPATVVDDTLADGAQPVTVTATVSAFGTGTGTGSVADNDAHHFTFAPIASPQTRNAPFAVTVTARDVNNAVITNYNSPVALTGAAGAGAVPVTPATLTGWSGGQWTGNVGVDALASGVVLTANDGQSHTGVSNAFNVVLGALHHFGWAPIASPQPQDTFFGVTVFAQDIGNNTVPSFTGTTALRAEVPAFTAFNIGTGTGTFNFPLRAGNHDARMQLIHTASELGGVPRRIRALALDVVTVPGQTLTAFTIRLKHTTLASYPTSGGQWESTGWTTVYQAAQTISQTGLVTFQFSTPFDYDGTSNLLVDFSFNNTTFTTDGLVRVTNTGITRSRYFNTNSGFGDPLTWSGTAVPASQSFNVPNLRLTVDAPPVLTSILPASTGNFTAGVWTGQVAIPFAGENLRLRATTSLGITGSSNVFVVAAPQLPGNSGTVLNEPFETPTLDPRWTVTGTGQFRTQLTTANTPHGGAQHLTMDAAAIGLARNEATVTVNLAGRTGVSLSFWAKEFGDEAHGPPPIPFAGGADFDGVAISADGTNWYEVQELRTLTATYAQRTVNLDAAIATHGLSYNANFKIRFNQYDDNPIPTDGIAIDDILLTATVLPTPTLTLPSQATEGAGALAGLVTLPAVAAVNTTVALVSNAPIKVSVPASVVVLAGQQTANFILTVLDNTLLDGNRTVGILATPTGGNTGSGTLLVVDNETTPLTITVPASATEGAVGVSGSVTLGSAPSGTIILTLASSDVTEATVPATLTFAPGQRVATFPITVLNDLIFDGNQNVVITASSPGWTPASGTLAVLDNRNLTFTLPTTLTEGQSSTGTVSLFGTQATPLVITLTNSNAADLTVPATVTIAASATSVTFPVSAVDDALRDGTRTASVTASATNFVSATRSVSVPDNDVDHFTFNTIATPQVANRPFTSTVFARDVNNVTIPVFTGTVNLTAAGSAGALAVTPASVTFAGGSFTGNVAIGATSTGVTITASGAGATGASNAFDVGIAAFDRFAWSPVASPRTVGVPFAATVSARDAFGNLVPTFTGTAALSCNPPARSVGTGTVAWEYPLYTFYHDARTQVIYPAAELGGAGTIASLALSVTTVPGQPLTAWTIRIKTTPLANYGASPVWESTGWTVVHQSTATVSTTGWVIFPFSTPFTYDGTSNLLIDFSFNNSSFTSNGASTATTAANVRSITFFTDSGFGDPLTWTGTTPPPAQQNNVPNLRLQFAGASVPMTPATTGAFVSGAWTGQVAIQQTATGVALRAVNGSSVGDSNAFDVTNVFVPADADGDGLPDGWETAHGLDHLTAQGADGPTGDADADGLGNLLEHAFGTDPHTADASPAPLVTLERDPADGQTYLTVRYRRLLAPGAIAYALEVSPDLTTWTAADREAQELLPTLVTGDGLTELVTLRLHPALATPGHPVRYVRVRVTAP